MNNFKNIGRPSAYKKLLYLFLSTLILSTTLPTHESKAQVPTVRFLNSLEGRIISGQTLTNSIEPLVIEWTATFNGPIFGIELDDFVPATSRGSVTTISDLRANRISGVTGVFPDTTRWIFKSTTTGASAVSVSFAYAFDVPGFNVITTNANSDIIARRGQISHLNSLQARVISGDRLVAAEPLIVEWTATFSESTHGVMKEHFIPAGDINDLSLGALTTITTPIVLNTGIFANPATQWRFTSSTTGSNEGDLTFDFNFNIANFLVITEGANVDTVPRIDFLSPSITSIVGTANHDAGTITWLVTFSEPVRNITSGNFRVSDTVGDTVPNVLGAVPANTGTGNTMEIVSTHTQDGNFWLEWILNNGSSGNNVPRDLSEASINIIKESTFTSSPVALLVNSEFEFPLFNNDFYREYSLIGSTSRSIDRTENGIGTLNNSFLNTVFDSIGWRFDFAGKASLAEIGANGMAVSDPAGGYVFRSDQFAISCSTCTQAFSVSISLVSLSVTPVRSRIRIVIGASTIDASHYPVGFRLSHIPDARFLDIDSQPAHLRNIYFSKSDETAPVINSITGTVENNTINWQVVFSEPVSDISPNHFKLLPAHSNAATFGTIPNNTGDGTSINFISTHNGNNDGNVRLMFDADGDGTRRVLDLAVSAVGNPPTTSRAAPNFLTTDFTSPSVTITVPPVVTDILPTVQSTDRTNNRIRWRVEFSEHVKNLSTANFSLVPAGGTIEIRKVQETDSAPPTTSRNIRVGTGAAARNVIGVLLYSHHTAENDGRIKLMFNGNSGATDLQDNILASDFTSQQTAFLDISPPIATITSQQNNNNIIWNIEFDEPVKNFAGLGNFNITPTGSNAIDFTPDENGFVTTATITTQHSPARDGEIRLIFNAANAADTSSVVRDRFENIAASATARHTIDLTPPTATISPQVTGNTITWRATFSEPMQNITQNKFTITNGTINSLQQGSNNKIYTITSTHTNIQTATTLTFNPQVGTPATDLAGNAFENSVVATNTPPTTTISSRQQGNNIIWDITFSKPVRNFGGGSLVITPAGTTRTIDFTRGQQFITSATITTEHDASRDGEITLTFDADRDTEGTVTDSANNIAPDATASRTIDLTPPTVSITSELNRNIITWELTFSESVQNITQNKFTITSGTLGTLDTSQQANNIYTITSTHSTTGQTTATLTFNPQTAPIATDEAGNQFAGATDSQPITTDITPPQLQSILASRITNSRNISYTITFSEAVENVSLDDFQITYTGGLSGSAGQISTPNETIYEFDLNINTGGNGNVSISLNSANNIVDKANNPLAASSISETTSFNSLAPTLDSIVLVSGDARTLTWQAQFNRRVRGVELADFSPNDDTNTTTMLDNFTATAADTNGFSQNWQFTSNTQGDGIISISFNKRNNNIVDTTATTLTTQTQTSDMVEFESVRPTVTIARENLADDLVPIGKNEIIYRARFSEPVLNVTANNFRLTPFNTLTPVVESVGTNNDIYDITFTLPTTQMADTTINLQIIDGDTITDRNRLRNPLMLPSNVPQVRYSTDSTAPTLAVSAQINGKTAGERYARQGETITYTLTFSEDVQGIAAGDGKTLFALSNTTLNAQASINIEKQSDAIYRVGLTMPNVEMANTTFHLTYIGTTIRDTSFHEIAFVAGTAGTLQTTPIQFIFDSNNPTTTITSQVNANTITWTITFNENVINIAQSHFSISNGRLGAPSATSGEAITITSTHDSNSDGNIVLTFTNSSPSATDTAGNTAEDSTAMQTIDRTGSTTIISSTVNNNQITWEINFGEAVSNISQNKFEISDGELGTPSATSGASITIISTHNNLSDGNIFLTFTANAGGTVVQDSSNNIASNAEASQIIIVNAPMATEITGTADRANNVINWVVTFSEPVENISASNFNISPIGATIGLVPADSTGTTISFASNHINSDDNFTLTFNSGFGARDLQGNDIVGTLTSPPVAIDTIAPTTMILAEVEGETIEWTVSFSETIEELAKRHFSISAGELGELVPLGATLVPIPGAEGTRVQIVSTHDHTSDGTITLTFNANVGNAATDMAGNLAQTEMQTATIDVPQTRIENITGQLGTSGTIEWRVEFSRPVQNLTAANFNLIPAGGTFSMVPTSSNVPTSSTNNIATIISNHTQNTDGEIRLMFDVSAGGQDERGNAIENDFTSQAVTIDLTPPTTTISSMVAGNTIVWTINFSEPILQLANSHFSISGGGVLDNVSATMGESATIISTHDSNSDGTITLTFNAGANGARDAAGNAAQSQTATNSIDATAPRIVSITGTADRENMQINWQVEFSEPVENISSSNFALSPAGTIGSVANVSTGNSLSFVSTHTPENDGAIILTFTPGNVQDLQGNAVANSLPSSAVNLDISPPTTTISAEVSETTITWTITFNENVMNTASRHFSISNGALGEPSATSGTAISIISTHTHETDGDIILTFNANGSSSAGAAATDEAGNVAQSATQTASIEIETPDTTPPTTSISSDVGETTITWAISFDENVMNTASRHFSISNGALGEPSATSGTAISIISTHTHETDGDIILTFNASGGSGESVVDGAGNVASNASGTATINIAAPPPPPEPETPEPPEPIIVPADAELVANFAQEKIATFLKHNAQQTVKTFPNLAARLQRHDKTKSLKGFFNANNESMDLAIDFYSYKGVYHSPYFALDDFQTWAKAIYVKGETEHNDTGEFFNLQLGGDFLYSENLVLGLMFEGNYGTLKNVEVHEVLGLLQSELQTQSFVLSPYVVADLNYGLVWVNRFGYGMGEPNFEIVSLSMENNFAGEHIFYSTSFEKQIEYEENYTLTPSVNYIFSRHNYESFMFGGVILPRQTIELHNFELSIDTQRDIDYGHFVLTPNFKLGAIFDSLASMQGDESSMVANIEAGLELHRAGGVRMGVGGRYDFWHDSSSLQTFGIRADLSIKF